MLGPISNPSRFDIINWINDTLLIHITKIEQLGSGSIYCHLLDAAYPQRIPLSKVKWGAKLQVDFLHNFKILQTSFQFLHLDKAIQVQKLVKAKFQDNFEFIQWMYSSLYSLIQQNSKEYEPLKRRKYATIYLDFCQQKKRTRKVNVTLHNLKNTYKDLKIPQQFESQSISDMKSSMSSVSSFQTIKSMKPLHHIMPLSNNKSSYNLNHSISTLTFNEPTYTCYKKAQNNNLMAKQKKFIQSQINQFDEGCKTSRKKYNGPTKSKFIESYTRRGKGIKLMGSKFEKQNKQLVSNKMMKNIVVVESEQQDDPFAVI